MATYDLTSSIPSKIQTGDILNCPYSGSKKTITLPKGKYKLECWGAQGGNYTTSYLGGMGGYSVGTIELSADSTAIYIYVGGQATTSTSTRTVVSGGFNGGGNGFNRSYSGSYTYGQGGGGGSDIRIGVDSLYARVIVAGGGGGNGSGSNEATTKYGGGTSGGSACRGYGASQTAAGTNGSFGAGGSATTTGYNYRYGSGGGGGGWYGGGACSSYSDLLDYRAYNGGGSGYVYTSSTASNYPSGCLLNSSYYLTDASTIAGYKSFASIDGGAETGHEGNGYARITVIECSSAAEFHIKANSAIYISSAAYTKVNGEWKEITDRYVKVNGSWVS